MITRDFEMGIIEVKNITFTYKGEETPVFQDFSMEVEEGSCLVIEGDNGSGKTTLFRILNGLSFPEKGKYYFDGKEIHEGYLKDNRNAKLFHKRMGYLFQNPDIMLFNATVYDEIAFGPRQMGMTDAMVRDRVGDCMELFNLKSLSGKAPYHLSGGQKKKVALAAVMALNPDVIILDEPFAGLDQKNRESLLAFFMELKKSGKTMLIASHNPMVHEKLADRLVLLDSKVTKNG